MVYDYLLHYHAMGAMLAASEGKNIFHNRCMEHIDPMLAVTWQYDKSNCASRVGTQVRGDSIGTWKIVQMHELVPNLFLKKKNRTGVTAMWDHFVIMVDLRFVLLNF